MCSLMMISDMLSKHVGAVKSVLKKWFKINDIPLVHLLVVWYLVNLNIYVNWKLLRHHFQMWLLWSSLYWISSPLKGVSFSFSYKSPCAGLRVVACLVSLTISQTSRGDGRDTCTFSHSHARRRADAGWIIDGIVNIWEYKWYVLWGCDWGDCEGCLLGPDAVPTSGRNVAPFAVSFETVGSPETFIPNHRASHQRRQTSST